MGIWKSYLLKKDWQKSDNSLIKYRKSNKMIHKKSSSIVKWILILYFEVLLWTC
jgi:hypothetical protein